MCGTLIEWLFLAFSLAMDAFAVSVSSGISVPGFGRRQAVRMGAYFGLFQFIMPLLGWVLGSGISGRVQAVDHWIAFGLLAVIGGRMVWDAAAAPCRPEQPVKLLTRRHLLALALATSMDALAVGISLAFLTADILSAALIIGAVAFLLSVLGGLAGRRLGCLFQRRAGIAGGLVLIGIGVKILVEHL
ncbi:MAG: manganese efflux pump [Oscillospiraceae bacterium]|nr:manganese efflux pump [Oscillospiraceae bacterium]